jgi:hypothetical protein
MSFISDVVETFQGSDCPIQKDLDWLSSMGVTVRALTEPDPFRRAIVKPVGPAWFDFVVAGEEESVAAMLFLARDTMGDPQDIIAWNPRVSFLRSHFGRARVLGEDEILRPHLEHDGCLRVWRDPIDWLLANRRGVVLLDGITSATVLAAGGPLMVEDQAHRREVLRLITSPLPQVNVATRKAAA